MIELNKIYNENCFQGMKRIDNNSIDLVITDPPYLHNKGGGTNIGTNGKSTIGKSGVYNFGSEVMQDMSSFGEKEIHLMLDEFKRVTKKMHCFIFCNDTQLVYYMDWCLKNKKKWIVLTWEKPLKILNRNRFSLNLEYIIRIYEQGASINKLDLNKYPNKKNYYSRNRKIPLVKPSEKIHPTQKPLEYVENIIELATKEGAVVLDPFSGSGTIPVGCLKWNRKYIGFENKIEHYKNSVNRIENYIKNK